MEALLLALSLGGGSPEARGELARRIEEARPARAADTMNLLAMSHDASAGRITLESGSPRLKRWPQGAAAPHAERRMREVASALDGHFIAWPAPMATRPTSAAA